jgi:hypothetical protein
MQGGMGGVYDSYDASAQYYMQPGMQGVMGQVLCIYVWVRVGVRVGVDIVCVCVCVRVRA